MPIRQDKAQTRPIAPPPAEAAARPAARHSARRWLLFVHQLPSASSNVRVKTWRRMQQLGAIAIKQAVYVLPDSPGAREDFEWLKSEVEGTGGDVSVFVADTVDAWSDDELVEEFRRSRQDAYAALAGEIEPLLRRPAAKRPRRATSARVSPRLLDGFRQRLAALEAIDFFGSAGRDRVVGLIQQLDDALAGPPQPASTDAHRGRTPRESYQHRLWVTRPRPGVDRMASGWLIRRFIDPNARFAFAADREAVPPSGIAFDMFGVEFTHQGDRCTFETLCQVFGIDHAAITRIAAIVHDLDLKDDRFNAPEAASIGAVIDGLRMTHAEDDALLAQGITLFEALYRAFDQSARRSGPRPVATRRTPRRGTPSKGEQ